MPFTKRMIQDATETCLSVAENKNVRYVVMGSQLKIELIKICQASGSDTGMADKFCGLEVVTCKGIKGAELFFFESYDDALELRKQINYFAAKGIGLGSLLEAHKSENRYSESQLNGGKLIKWGEE